VEDYKFGGTDPKASVEDCKFGGTDPKASKFGGTDPKASVEDHTSKLEEYQRATSMIAKWYMILGQESSS
jgi:hypothetical protein